ncbi:hypothetical protein [Novosphingobium sp. PY1]|uniref:hypothetical protein n=1 Tax=Novosphingobium sp. PY1 TaxID=1882221 RepID=UPI001A8DAB6B|nr:hypothetical protein [Novosphingobium sp. PY1]
MDTTETRAADAWFSVLDFSPSFEVARQIRAGTLPEGAVVPADIGRVLEVFDDLGSVTSRDHDEVQEAQFRWMGHFGKLSQPAELGVVRVGNDAKNTDVMDGLEAYMTKQWIIEGQPTAVIAAIPIGMPRAELIKRITAMLDKFPPDSHLTSDGSPKYQILDKRVDLSSVERYLDALRYKQRRKSLKNWQIGVLANLSVARSNLYRKSRKQPGYDQTEDRIALKEAASRALNRGHMIAENAARGIFPSYEKCEHALPMDWDRLYQQWWVYYRDYLGSCGEGYSPVYEREFAAMFD